MVKYGNSSLSHSVRLFTMNGSATSSQDFTQIDGHILTFSPQQSRQTVVVAIVDDTILEEREYFTVQLISTDPRVDLAQSTAKVWIIDDDSKLP